MFEKYVDNSNFTCKYELRPSGKLFFGMKCVTSMQSKIDKLLKEQNDKSEAEKGVTCDEICLKQKSYQPSYDEFSLLSTGGFRNRTALVKVELFYTSKHKLP